MKIKIIDNIGDFLQFEAQNVFQTVEWMRLFEGEEDTRIVLFAVYRNAQSTKHRPQFLEVRDGENFQLLTCNSQLLLVQPVTIQRFVKCLPWRLGAYAVAWRAPWRAENIVDEEAIEAFRLMTAEIEKYCKKRALYIEYRHLCQCTMHNVQCTIFDSYKKLPWYNIYREFEAGEDVAEQMKRDKRRQLKQSFEAGVEVVLEPTREQIVEWYGLLKRLYRRIHRPLPSVDVFLRLNKSGIGRVFVVMYRGRVISGNAMLFHSSSLTPNSPLFYDWYRASVDVKIEGVYPSVVSTWQALQLVADMGGGRFDFMGAGPRNKEYGVRQFKLEFGGNLTEEYRYRKYLF